MFSDFDDTFNNDAVSNIYGQNLLECEISDISSCMHFLERQQYHERLRNFQNACSKGDLEYVEQEISNDLFTQPIATQCFTSACNAYNTDIVRKLVLYKHLDLSKVLHAAIEYFCEIDDIKSIEMTFEKYAKNDFRKELSGFIRRRDRLINYNDFLDCAIKSGYVHILNYFIERGAKISNGLLQYAPNAEMAIILIQKGDTEYHKLNENVVRELIYKGYEIDDRRILYEDIEAALHDKKCFVKIVMNDLKIEDYDINLTDLICEYIGFTNNTWKDTARHYKDKDDPGELYSLVGRIPTIPVSN